MQLCEHRLEIGYGEAPIYLPCIRPAHPHSSQHLAGTHKQAVSNDGSTQLVDVVVTWRHTGR